MADKIQQPSAGKPKCGIIMPISASDGYTEEHWQDVLQVIQDAANSAGFEADLVSANGRADVIQSTIVDNIFHNEIVICDVSSMNPNVMLELGLRFAAKKPVIIIFDTNNKYPFDIHQLRFYEYGKNLRYSDLIKFKDKLSQLISAVYDDDKTGKYKPYLSNFTDISIDPATVPSEQISVVEALEKLTKEVREIKYSQDPDHISPIITNAARTSIVHLDLKTKRLIEHISLFTKFQITTDEYLTMKSAKEKIQQLTSDIVEHFKHDLTKFTENQRDLIIARAINDADITY